MTDTTKKPYYQHHLFICTNKRPNGHERGSCIDCGGGEIRNYMKERCKALGIQNIRVNASGCLDRCEQGAVLVIYPEETWYSLSSIEEAERIIQEHLVNKNPVDDLRI